MDGMQATLNRYHALIDDMEEVEAQRVLAGELRRRAGQAGSSQQPIVVVDEDDGYDGKFPYSPSSFEQMLTRCSYL